MAREDEIDRNAEPDNRRERRIPPPSPPRKRTRPEPGLVNPISPELGGTRDILPPLRLSPGDALKLDEGHDDEDAPGLAQDEGPLEDEEKLREGSAEEDA